MKPIKWITTSLAALLLLLIASPLMGQLGKVHGTALEGEETLPTYSVRLRSNGGELRRSMTDAKGKYEFALLPPGDYEIEIEESGVLYRQPFTLGPGETRPLPIDIAICMAFDAEGNRIYRNKGAEIIESPIPIFTVDPIQPQVVGRIDLGHMPGRGLDAAIPSFQGVYQKDVGDPLNINGSRADATAIYVDNVKVRGDYQVPNASIAQIALMNHGVPAEFGDMTGGVIVITTYNPGMKPTTGARLSKAERKSIRARQKSSPKGADAPVEAIRYAHS